MSVRYPENSTRSCDFCPRAMQDGSAISLAQLGYIDQLTESGERCPINRFKYGWMAGGSSHKLAMFKEVLGIYPGLLYVEELYPMRMLSKHGLSIYVPKENPMEKSGVKIAQEKLDSYWSAFKNFELTQSCRRYGPQGSPKEACQPDHFLFATDVNVWANTAGESRNGGVCLRNPDETFENWKTFTERQKRDAIISYMTGQYKLIESDGLVTNTVESALALRRPIDLEWNKVLDAAGSSKMHVTMPLCVMQSEDFVNAYIDYVISVAIGTSRSQTTANGVLNNIGGAAGGIMMEKMIEFLRISGYEDIRIDLPGKSTIQSDTYDQDQESLPDELSVDTESSVNLTEWDIIRGHALGMPHILVRELIQIFTRNKLTRVKRNPIQIHSAHSYKPSKKDVEELRNSALWKDC